MIYTRGGCQVKLLAKHTLPTGFRFFTAEILSAYPDGSGADKIGEVLHIKDRSSHGWEPEISFCADEGSVEISEAARKLEEVKLSDSTVKKLCGYFGIIYAEQAA